MNDTDYVEREYLASILQDFKNDYEILERTRIKPQYLLNEKNRKLMEFILDYYKKNKTIVESELIRNYSSKGFDIVYYFELLTEQMYCIGERGFRIAENRIIDNYKNSLIEKYNEMRRNKTLTFDEYASKVKKLDEIKIIDSTGKMLTAKDINTNEQEVKIFVKSGINTFDKKINGFILGELSVWSGGNASAKSTFLNQLAIESINQDYKVAIYSGELTSKRLMNWICLQCAGKNNISFNQDKNYYFVNSFSKEKIINWLNDKLYVYDNDFGNKAQDVIESITDAISRFGIKVIILDNLMSMDLNSYGDNKYDVQSKFIQELSAIAKKYNVHIHFICHPRKVTTFLRKVDISGSGDITNVADNVFIMHRVNQDFKLRLKEMFKLDDDNELFNYSNVLEICKNREYGLEDVFIGMYFDISSKRLLNYEDEVKKYGWEDKNE